MLKKVLVSFAENTHTSLLEISIASLYKYSCKYNYDLIIPSKNIIQSIAQSYDIDINRPTSWLKIPILLDLISKYDVVLWIDADIVINKFDIDIISELHNKDFTQAFVVHHTPEGYIPNCGVWILNKNSKNLLLDIWNQVEYIEHCWWEQKANMSLMNWNQKIEQQDNLSDYGKTSIELPYEWNMHKCDSRYDLNSEVNCRFLHATTYIDRFNTMKDWANRE
ncbi:MAG: hypothetical protein EBU90_03725 [Proteobacteria bacterium]|nr:hypothetical protein [Pseudomonadota bacterium]NBP13665.1 hypothetical protein [bacterium]